MRDQNAATKGTVQFEKVNSEMEEEDKNAGSAADDSVMRRKKKHPNFTGRFRRYKNP